MEIPIEKDTFNSTMLFLLAIPYLNGAIKQVERYKVAASMLGKDPINSVNKCLHETSCLFEDLGSVAKYSGLCAKDHQLNSLWITIRNHIRHDFRENLNTNNKKEIIKRDKRLKDLGIAKHLLISISFDPTYIQIGTTNIRIIDIEEYLKWATKAIESTLEKAKTEGIIN